MRASVRLGALCLAAAALLALPQGASAQTKLLSVSVAGSGSGTVQSSPEGIACPTSCTASFPEGSTVTLSATSAPNTQPVRWEGCDSIAAGNCIVAIDGPRSITAAFALQRRPLAVAVAGRGTGTITSSPAGISCPGSCGAQFDLGSTVTLTGSPAPGSLPLTWTGCDSIGPQDRCAVSISQARQVTASFEIDGPTLTIAEGGSGIGTVTSSPAGIECGTLCSIDFPKGQTVVLSATPGLHSLAAAWTGCESQSAGKCTVTMGSSKSVGADFELEAGIFPIALTIAKAGTGEGTVTASPGQILCGAICAEALIPGSTRTLTATPAPGSVFAHWSGGGCTGASPCTKAIATPRTVKAIFTATGTRTLTVQRAGTGQGTVTSKAAGIECGTRCASQVPAAKKLTLLAKAAPGSTFTGFSGACSGTGSCTVRMSEARSLTATFTAARTAAALSAQCTVPRLAGKSLRAARAALATAHCSLGRVTRPKARGGKVPHPLVVRRFSPEAGAALPAGGKVDLRLGRARRRSGG